MSTTAAFTTDHTDGPLRLDLQFRVGDSWLSRQWAVLVNGDPVDLTSPGWAVRAQCRERATDADVLHEWSTGNNRVRLGTAEVTYDNGPELTTSTVQLAHGPADVTAAFDGHVDVEIARTSGGVVVERWTIAAGRCRATRDVTR